MVVQMDKLPGFDDDSGESLEEARDRAAAGGRRAAENRIVIPQVSRERKDTGEPQPTPDDWRKARKIQSEVTREQVNIAGIQQARQRLNATQETDTEPDGAARELSYEEATPGLRRSIAEHEAAEEREELRRNAAGLEVSGEESQVERGLDPGDVMGARQDSED